MIFEIENHSSKLSQIDQPKKDNVVKDFQFQGLF